MFADQLRLFILFFLFTFLSLELSAQSDFAKRDSLRDDKMAKRAEKYAYLNPPTAAYLSLALPGAGQFYNKSYWKIPLVYGGLATFTSLAIYNHNEYISYKRSYNNRRDNDPNTQVDPEHIRLTENGLKANRNSAKKYRDLNIILGVLFYGLNIADAYIDAHLKGFDVNDDISLNIDPMIYTDGNNLAGGLTLNIRLK